MSKALGVTEARVRNLKDKALAVYSLYEGEEDTWWQKPLLANLASAKYDANSKRFKFRIIDKGVRNALQNYFDYETETKGNYFEHTLTSSVITMDEGSFTVLLASILCNCNSVGLLSAGPSEP